MATAEIVEYQGSEDHGYSPPVPIQPRVGSSMMAARQAQEVQGAIVSAKKFPRDQDAAVARILTSCKRKRLAEEAEYEYKRGGEKISGASIRLMEVIAQAWGNISYGVVELERMDGESLAMSYAWDIENNTRCEKVFTVRHVRDSKKGRKELTDERDIYETVANYGARRMRACIEGVIPRDVQDAAVDACRRTLKDGAKEPLADRIRKMLVAFTEHGVTQAMIEAKLGHKVGACSDAQIAKLQRHFVAIRDGIADREEFFDLNAGQEKKDTLDTIKPAIGDKKATKPESPADPPSESPDHDLLEIELRAKIRECQTKPSLSKVYCELAKQYPDRKAFLDELHNDREMQLDERE